MCTVHTSKKVYIVSSAGMSPQWSAVVGTDNHSH